MPAKPAATTPQPDPQAAVRRDYELALQLGTRDVWQAFLVHYPEGYYANLANGQLNKIAAEEARAAAAEKARVAEQERTRLEAERAEKAEQEKAAAEQARAEVERAAAQKAIAEKSAAETVAAETVAKQTSDDKPREEKVAALSPAGKADQATAADLSRALQAELRRVGCNTGAVDGNWNAVSQKALDLFNKHSGLKLDVKTASANALDAVKSKAGRICPLICDSGYRVDSDKCTKIACRAGYRLNDDDEC